LTDKIYLILLITIPIIVPALAVITIFGEGSWGGDRYKSALALNAEKGLSHHGLLWLCITVPCFYFVALCFIAWQGYSVALTSEGLNTFVKISSLPLAVLSMSLPLSVLVSRFHATCQTAEQIKITKQKNNIDLFHSHRNELFNYFSQIGEINYLGCLNAKYKVHPRIHKNFFSGLPITGTPQINEETFSDIERELNSARWQLDVVIKDKNPELTFDFYIANLCRNIYRLGAKLGLPEIHITLAEKSILVPVKIKGNQLNLLTVGKTTNEAIAAYRYAKNYYDNLCDFAGRQNMAPDDNELKYIDSGGSFVNIHSHLVIEKIHETNIKDLLHSKQT
jgi:hypothetical protein